MRFPPRLGHLATRAIVAAKLRPTYAGAHRIDDEEAGERLERALRGELWDRLLEAAWRSLTGKAKKLDEAGLLEKVAGALQNHAMRAGRTIEPNAAWSAFLLIADLEAGTASDSARRVLETPQGKQLAERGLEEVGAFLAGELTRR